MTKPDAIADAFPLTPLQDGLLFHSVYAPGGGQYHDQFSAVLRGPLRPEVLAEAWGAVVAATPALRTAFSWKTGGRPMQVVLRRVDALLRLEEWRPLAEPERAARCARLREEDLRLGFDLARPPLTRVTLARFADDAWHLLWSRHHLLLDGWSVTLVLRDWLAAYAELAHGRTPAAAPAPSFRDYVEWLRGRDEEGAEAFWRSELGDLEEPPAIGLALPPETEPPADRPRHGEIDRRLSGGESEALLRLARSARVTLATVFQGAWGLLLARLAGEREAVFGHTVAVRPSDLPGAERMVGLCINTIPLRLRVRPDLPAGAWLRAVQDRAAAAREFEHAALVKIHGWSGVARDRPLFESLLVVENYPADQALAESLGSVRVEEARSHERTHYPATLIATPGERIGLRLLYDRARLTDVQAGRWMEGLRTLLAAMAGGADRPVGGIGVGGPDDVRRVPGGGNAPALDRTATLPRLVAAQAARTPDAVAVDDGRRRLSYAELRRRAGELAGRLRAAGAGPETCVGVCLERSTDLVVALLGVLESGAAYVPLDPAYPPERLAFMAADARLVALVTQPGLDGRVPGLAAPPIFVEEEGAAAGPPPGPPRPENLAYLIYTSGSTGRPKAAAIEHRQAAALVQWALTVFSRDELAGVLFSTSVCFDLSVFEVFVTLAAGGRVIVADNALALPAHPARGEVTLVNTVPSAAAELARQGALPASVRCVCLAGEPLSAALADRLYGFPQVGRVCDLYGPSEDTTYSTFAERARGGPATIGRVIAHSRLYLLDEDLQPAPVGTVGEIHLAGAGLARGYFGRPDLTAERFGPDPFSPEPGGRLYRTGDLARFREDGQLEFLGRRDHQVKIRGYRIELGEIQARLESHPEVAEAAVLAREHPARGRYLAAFVAPVAGAAPAVGQLAAWVGAALPAYMMPAAWHLLEILPRTPNGKLDRRALPADGAGAGPSVSAPRPSDPVQEIVAGIWAEILGVGAVRTGDNFFGLGGHSLLATQAVARVRNALQADVPLRALFDHPTLGAFAGAVRARRTGIELAEDSIARRPEGEEPPLSFAQERMWAIARLAPDSPAYHLPAALEVTGDLDPAALGRALAVAVARHEALRMSFPETDGRPRVALAGEPGVALAGEDLRELPPGERLAAARRIAAAEGWAPFDLARGPLVRARLLRLEERRHWLLLTVHHIATDGWSEWVLVRELADLYAGRALPGVALGYGDYARWQRARAAEGGLARQVRWWRDELAGLPALELPGDGPRPAALTHRGGAVRGAVGEVEAEHLRALGRAGGATLAMVLLAAWEAWLWRHSGQTDFGVGVPVAGRTRPECEGIVGLFVNTLVIRSDVSADLRFAELLRRVRERMLRAYDRQEAPFEQVVDAVQPPRDPSRSPLFQVMFNLQNTPRVELDLGAARVAPVELEATGAKFELTLTAVENRDGSVGLTLEHNRDRFEPATAEKFLERYRAILQTVAAGDVPLAALLPELGETAPPRPESAAPALPPAGFVAPSGAIETLLAELWAGLLGVPRVGRHDNFFALGGDSIVALQVAARAAAAGVRLPAQAVFRHQTLAELAAVAAAAGPAAGGGVAEGEGVRLAPIQCWFFEREFAQSAHWNQSALFVAPADFAPARFASALRRAAGRHEAFHLRYARGPEGMTARRGSPEASAAFTSAPLADLPAAAARAQAELDPSRGPLLRAVHFPPPAGGEGRLLLVAHHLAIDVVSWDVLLADLADAYAAPDRELPPAPAWSAWTRALQAEADRPETAAELAHWRDVPSGPPLPRDFPALGSGTAADEAAVEVALSSEETRALLRDAGVQAQAALLAALARALGEWTGRPGHTLALEGHGREEFAGSPPVDRAVGWFTTLFPVRLELPPSGSDPGSLLWSVQERLRAVPRRGFGYGLLRYLGPSEARTELSAQPWPDVCFNYLGRLDAPAPAGNFRLAPEPRGPDHGPANARPFLLEVTAAVRGGALHCAWAYSRAHHGEATVRRLADGFLAALRALAARAGPPALEDFSAVGLSQSDLDKVLSRQH